MTVGGRWIAITLATVLVLMMGCASSDQLTRDAEGLYQQGQRDRASKLWTRSVKKNPRDSQALYGLSRCARDAGRLQEALVYIERAIANDSAWSDLVVHRGNIYFEKSKVPGVEIEERLYFLTKAIDDHSTHRTEAINDRVTLHFQLATEMRRAGDLLRATEYLDLVIADKPAHDEALRMRADVYYDRAIQARDGGDPSRWLEYLTAALGDNSDHASARHERARAHFHFANERDKRGDLSGAYAKLHEALDDDPEYPEARAKLVEVVLALAAQSQSHGRHVQAVENFDEAARFAPEDPRITRGKAESYYALGVEAEEKGRLSKSLEHLYSALENVRKSKDYFPFRGDLHARIAQREAGANRFEKVREHADLALEYLRDERARSEVSRLRGFAYFELSAIAAKERDAYDEAFEYLDRALSDHPPLELEIHLRRGEIHALRFDFESALRATQKAYRVSNDDSINLRATYNLARYSAIMNRTEESIDYLLTLYHFPDLFSEARRMVKADINDFYTIYADRRFQAWLAGETRVRLDVRSADITFCKDGFGICDPYIKLVTGSHTIWYTNYFDDDHRPIWNDHLVTNLSLDRQHQLVLWDKDLSDDDKIGSLLLPRELLVEGGSRKKEIRSNLQLIGYLYFEVQPTDGEVDMSVIRLSPSIGVLAWPIIGCLTEFGVARLVEPSALRSALGEVQRSFEGKEFKLDEAVLRFGGEYLKEVILGPAGVVLDVAELGICLGQIEY